MFTSKADDMLYMEYKAYPIEWRRNLPHLFAVMGAGYIIHNIVKNHGVLNYTKQDLYITLGAMLAASVLFAALNYKDNEYKKVQTSQKRKEFKTEEKYEEWLKAQKQSNFKITEVGSMALFCCTMLYAHNLLDQAFTTAMMTPSIKKLIGAHMSDFQKELITNLASSVTIALGAQFLLSLYIKKCVVKDDMQRKSKWYENLDNIARPTSIIAVGLLLKEMSPQIAIKILGYNPFQIDHMAGIMLQNAILLPFIALAFNHIMRNFERKAQLELDKSKGSQSLIQMPKDRFDLLMNASTLAQYRDPEIEFDMKGKGYDKMYYVFEKHGSHAVVFYNLETKHAIVAFRPTFTQEEGLIDLKFSPTKADFGENVMVHGGIYRSMKNLQHSVEGALKAASGDEDLSKIELSTVGHSLGSALATLYGLEFQDKYYNKDAEGKILDKPLKRVEVLATGAPNVVYDNHLVDQSAVKLPNINMTRVEQKVDPVDRLGFLSWGANGVGEPISAPQELRPHRLVHTPGAYHDAMHKVYKSGKLSFDENPLSHSTASILGHLASIGPFFSAMVRGIFSGSISETLQENFPVKMNSTLEDSGYSKVEMVDNADEMVEEFKGGHYNTRANADSVKLYTSLKEVVKLEASVTNKIMRYIFGGRNIGHGGI